MWYSPIPDFKVDNKGFVKVQFFKTTWPCKKLFKISQTYKIISQSYTLLSTLCLPEFICFIHPVFHVSMLKQATSNTFTEVTQSVPILVIIDGKPEYKISWIIDLKIDQK